PPSLSLPLPRIYLLSLSLHDALPIFETRQDQLPPALFQLLQRGEEDPPPGAADERGTGHVDHQLRRPLARQLAKRLVELRRAEEDRKSTRLNSSHEWISYAVFCLKKK